jgi:hypothetical protein
MPIRNCTSLYRDLYYSFQQLKNINSGRSYGILHWALRLEYQLDMSETPSLVDFSHRFGYDIMWPYLLTYSMEQSPSWEANWFCS